jgi:hypothetical protein
VQTFREYGLRFDIEEAFRDDKSAGFLLEDTKLLAADTVDRLLLVMATAYLFTVATGTAIVRTGKRHWVDTHWQRGLSYFQLGWRAFRRALHLGAVFLCEPLLIRPLIPLLPNAHISNDSLPVSFSNPRNVKSVNQSGHRSLLRG